MEYFKINGVDFSKYVNSLSISKSANYSAQTNAAGDTVVDYINSKRTLTVGIIPLTNSAIQEVLAAVDGFTVALSFLNPNSGATEENVNFIVPAEEVKFYTIQAGKVMLQQFTLKFIEL